MSDDHLNEDDGTVVDDTHTSDANPLPAKGGEEDNATVDDDGNNEGEIKCTQPKVGKGDAVVDNLNGAADPSDVLQSSHKEDFDAAAATTQESAEDTEKKEEVRTAIHTPDSSDMEEDTPTSWGTVQEKVEYFQSRQNEAEARRLQEEQLFNSRTRSPLTPQLITKVEDIRRETENTTAALSPSIHVPTLVEEIEEHASLNQQSVSLLDPSSWFSRFRQPINPHPPSGNTEAGTERVDDMISQADQRLRRQSQSFERLYRQHDADNSNQVNNLNRSGSNDGSFASSTDSERQRKTFLLETELHQAEQYYARSSLEGVARELNFVDEDVLEEAEAAEGESMERTRAMMAQDDFVPSASSFNQFDNQNETRRRRSLHGLPSKNGLVVRSFPTPPTASVRRGRSKDPLDSKGSDDAKFEIVHKQAFFEVPLEITEGAIKLTPKLADLTMMTTIPPSKLGGAWSGSLAGKSSIGLKNESSGSAMLEYKSTRWTRLSMGLTRGFQKEQNLITIGGRLLRRGGSSLGIGLYHHPITWENARNMKQWLWSCSYRQCFPNSKWYLFSQISRRQDAMLILSNNKLSCRVGWNLQKSKQLLLRVDARPRLSEHRKAHVYCQWKSGVWQAGLSLAQSLHSQISTVGLGWRVFSSRGIQWVFSWNRGNASINIPVLVTKELTQASFGHVMYLSLVSYLVQECVGEMWGWIGASAVRGTTERSLEANLKPVDPAKARKDAETQKELMTRQAKRKMKLEQEKDGLVIMSAVYSIKGGEKVHVTTQLQFWVSHSTLILPARPKSELLGLYDVVTSLQKSETTTATHVVGAWTWKDIWKDLLGIKDTGSLCSNEQHAPPVPTLTIEYSFKGKSYTITVKDYDEVRLPSSQATIIG